MIIHDFKKIECCNCGILFAVSETMNNHWKDDKKTFHCPNGHPQSYTESEADRLKVRLDAKVKIIISLENQIDVLKNPKPEPKSKPKPKPKSNSKSKSKKS